jgi:hypothetical protein
LGYHGQSLRFYGDLAGKLPATHIHHVGLEMPIVPCPATPSTLIPKFAVGPVTMRAMKLGSDYRSPRARHRFRFSGSLARQKKEKVTTDDLLDSLTRQAELRQKLGESDQVRLEEIAETEDLSLFQGIDLEPASDRQTPRRRGLGHLVFFITALSGLTIVWLYSSISKPFDLSLLNGIIQKSGIQSVFANQAQLGIIALTALLGALWIRHRRRGLRAHLVSR